LLTILITLIGIFMSNPSFAIFQETVIKSLGGQPLKTEDYKGKVVLVVNVATQCGYTPQLSSLQKLHDQFAARGFSVVGVPSNDYGGQTPEAAPAVEKFCQLNYGVKFPLTEKVVTKGKDKHPLFVRLLELSSDKQEIAWNFEKFLIGKDQKVLARFPSAVDPMSEPVRQAIEKALKE